MPVEESERVMRVTVVIPVKRLSDAKSRLSPILDPERRKELVIEMLSNVLSAARQSEAQSVVVVSPDPLVGELASSRGLDWMPDPASALNETLLAAFRACWERSETPLYLPADLPRLVASDVDGIIDVWAGEDRVVVSPSRDEQGTNALLVPGACRVEPGLGKRSFARHVARAERLGFALRVYRTPGLALDIDTPEDILEHRGFHRASSGFTPVKTGGFP
jgi:2-phospho-L-lactate guanylyltransferase